MEQLPILSMIKREMARKRINATDLSRGLNMNHSSVAGMLKRPTLQVQRLAELSEFLQYNFFREIAAELPYPEPDCAKEMDRTEVDVLQTRIKELEMEVGILRQTLKDLVSR
ncbi:hypothetical protein AQPE_4826 [Aquipluma nitroreducens]|uniref:HTH cro/C1-type domain-containing protein n=1 Tax=Aquipluma nitroreducens TaxID=2010828 RepID=A0A5K7SG76_9BACT|nr:hypothetical protein AQPE_4826 [Aquipluma nitroreducens]